MRVKNLFLILIAALFLVGCSGSHSVKSYTWERITVDSTYDEMEDPSATEAIAKYKDLVDPLQEITIYKCVLLQIFKSKTYRHCRKFTGKSGSFHYRCSHQFRLFQHFFLYPHV